MRHPTVSKIPNGEEAPNTYIFRMALCMHVWGHRWISVGGAGKTKVEKIRNDLIDVSFAAYATFFDGILSSDKKVKYIYGVAAWLLKNVCGCACRL